MKLEPMTEGSVKRKAPRHMADFVTALEPEACRDRLARADASPGTGVGTKLTPIAQHTQVARDGQFAVERTFAGGLHPIRFVGHLDPDESGGTWVHGAITHDTANQVLIEGLIAFLVFFLGTVLLFLRLRALAFAVSIPMLFLLLVMLSARWRTLRRATDDIARWLRQRLYLTDGQVRGRETK
ncbi:MAG: hypothetical protein OZ934_08000 [Anaerolineae bacterium]|nr:hypothetical protein [Anaerolineae bacterium]